MCYIYSQLEIKHDNNVLCNINYYVHIQSPQKINAYYSRSQYSRYLQAIFHIALSRDIAIFPSAIFIILKNIAAIAARYIAGYFQLAISHIARDIKKLSHAMSNTGQQRVQLYLIIFNALYAISNDNIIHRQIASQATLISI